ncbi:MAG: hypothetical protein KDC90_09895 [Ignavibacteriae bacterium]|nr:hypothetical protein [Ignavibacteriota bacterium]
MKVIDKSNDNITLGVNSKIIGSDLTLGENIVVRDHTIIAGKKIKIEDNVVIGNDNDIRSTNIYISRNTEIGNDCKILVADLFKVGSASRISSYTNITCRHFEAGNFLYLANNVSVGYGGTMESTAKVTLGNRVALGPYNILNANLEIQLADKVGTGSYVTFWTHGFHFGHTILQGYQPTFQSISIAENVWLGYHVTVLPGVSIGKNSIVAAGGVVAGNLPSNYLLGGVPVKKIKPLKKKNISDEESIQNVLDILDLWVKELHYKGIKVQKMPLHGSDAVAWEIVFPKTQVVYHVCMLLSPIEKQPHQEIIQLDHVIALSLHKGNEWVLSSDQNALFNLKSEEFLGRSSTISEDLRDFLRRRTLGCGFDKCYKSIEPEVFNKLKSLHLLVENS